LAVGPNILLHCYFGYQYGGAGGGVALPWLNIFLLVDVVGWVDVVDVRELVLFSDARRC